MTIKYSHYTHIGPYIYSTIYADKQNCKVCAKKLSTVVIMNLAQNPIMISTFLGLIYSLINPPVRDYL